MKLMKTYGEFEVYADRDGHGFFFVVLDTQTGWYQTAETLARACKLAVKLAEPLVMDFDPAAA